MILIKCIGGPNSGEVWEPSFQQPPIGHLFSLVNSGLGWEIDFSRASREETIAWGGADLMARAYRAVKNGRSVSFLGVEYTRENDLQAFEDALVDSRYDVQVARDNEEGLEVQIVQPE